MLTYEEISEELDVCEGQNEQFQLPDGSLVGTGNLRLPSGPMNVFGDYPESLLLDDTEIKRLLSAKSIKDNRDRHSPYMLNQGQVGSCNAYMAAAMHHQCQLHAGRDVQLLQPEHLYMNINGGRDNGSMLDRGMQWMVNNGCAPKGSVPYQSYQRSRISNIEEVDREGRRFRIHEPYVAPTDYDKYVRAVASALARGYPVGIAWHVSSGSMRLRNGFCIVGSGPGNHASLLHSAEWVGGRDLIVADLQNSWGTRWGEAGFGKITMQDLFRTRRYHQHYVMTSLVDDPKGENPL
jgi:hypothetical protein